MALHHWESGAEIFSYILDGKTWPCMEVTLFDGRYKDGNGGAEYSGVVILHNIHHGCTLGECFDVE